MSWNTPNQPPSDESSGNGGSGWRGPQATPSPVSPVTDSWGSSTTPVRRADVNSIPATGTSDPSVDGVDSSRAAPLDAPATAPLGWLGVALACVVVGALVGAVVHRATSGVFGWLMGGPIAIGLLAIFTVMDGRRRQDGWYRPSGVASWLQRVIVSLSLVAIVTNAWWIADAVARKTWT